MRSSLCLVRRSLPFRARELTISVAALFDLSKRRVAVILLAAWMMHLATLHAVDPWLS